MSASLSPSPYAHSWADHVRATLVLGLPLVGAQLAHMAINLTDTLMIGRLGSLELAAAVLGTQLLFVILMTISGLATAVMPLAAGADSAGDVRGVRRAVRMGLWAVSAASLVGMIPMLAAEPLFLALGQKPDVSALAAEYVRIAAFGLWPALLVWVLRSYLSALERARVVLWATLGGVVVNAVLNYLLIFGKFGAPALGVEGAAIASVATQLSVAGFLTGYCALKSDLTRFGIFERLWRPDWDAMWDILRLGAPISLTLLAEAGLFWATALMIGWIGTVPLAAHGIALQVISILFMIPYGLSQATTVRIGRAQGRGDALAVGRAGWCAILLTVVFATFAAAVILSLPATLVRLFLDADNPDTEAIVAYGRTLLFVAAAFQMVDMVQVVAISMLRGLRDTAVPMAVALVSYWGIGVPAAYGLGIWLNLGGAGVWGGLAIGLSVAAACLTLRFALRDRLGLVTHRSAPIFETDSGWPSRLE